MTKLYHSKKWIETQLKKGLTADDIAKQCNVSYQIVNLYIRKFGLK